MKVLKDLSAEVPGTNAHYFRLDKLGDEDYDNLLFWGYNSYHNKDYLELAKKAKRAVLLQVYMPTEYCHKQDHFGVRPFDHEDAFDEVWSICPLTVNWLNSVKGTDKYKAICYPYSEYYIPEPTDKVYDVIYHGGIHGGQHLDCLEIISKFNYRYLSQTFGINQLTRAQLHRATDTNLDNEGKLEIIAKTKISVAYNFFNIREPHISNIKSNPRWEENEAFQYLDSHGLVPQIKSRFIEAAYCRTLNLVQKDPWNLIENYFEPNKEYITFEDNSELEDKIREILRNWEDYQEIVDAAYNKVLNYSTEKLYSIINSVV